VLLFFYVIVCLLMCLVVLMQRSKQEGLGAAFGGGFTESVWGAQTSRFWSRHRLARGAFFISASPWRGSTPRAVLMEKGSPVQQELLKPVRQFPVPAVVPTVDADDPNLARTRLRHQRLFLLHRLNRRQVGRSDLSSELVRGISQSVAASAPMSASFASARRGVPAACLSGGIGAG